MNVLILSFFDSPPIHYLTAPSRYGWGMVSCIAHTQWLLCLCSSMNFFHRFGYVMMSQRVLRRIKGPSINDVTHLGGKGDQPKGDSRHYSISLISEMGDKGEGWVKNLTKWVTLFIMNGPQ